MTSLLAGVAATALLVNHSRARRVDLSLDYLAHEWIAPTQRADVEALWAGCAVRGHPNNEVVVSVRCRAVLEFLEHALIEDPDVTLVNIGAGFTSYPWLLPFRRAIEIDQETVVAAKQARVAELTTQGGLPARSVEFLAVDLRADRAVEGVVAEVQRRVPADGSVVVVAEGLVYYLPEQACLDLLDLPGRLERQCLGALVSYWPTGARDNPVLRAQDEWLADHGLPGDPTLLSGHHLRRLANVTILSPAVLQDRYGVRPALAEDTIVPEYVAVSR